MSNLHRIRSNFKSGTLGGDLLTTATTINFGSDPGFATLGTDEYLVIVIDPEGAGNGPEVVYLTAFTATNTTGTIERGKEGTSDPGLTHSSGTAWKHGPTVLDFEDMVVATETATASGIANLDLDISGFEAVRLTGWFEPVTDGAHFYIRLSNDGGSSFLSTNEYYYAREWNGIDVAAAGDERAAAAGQFNIGDIGNAAGERVIFDFLITSLADSSVWTMITGNALQVNATPNMIHKQLLGVVKVNEVHNAVRFLFSAGNIDDGRVTVWGYPTPPTP